MYFDALWQVIQRANTRVSAVCMPAGKKLYAVRDDQGKFDDIQTYQRAQAGDMRQTSKAELEKKVKAKKSAKAKAPPTKKKAKKAKPAKGRK